MKEVLCIIPASGQVLAGVKRNLHPLGGEPLIAHTIKAAKSSRKISRVIVVTDDSEIAGVAKQYGAEVPLRQPKELTAPGVSVTHVFQWVLNELSKIQNYRPDIVVFIEAVHPFREIGMLDNLVNTLEKEQLDTVFFASKVPERFWFNDPSLGLILLREEDSVRSKREPLFKEIGGLGTACKTDVVLSGQRIGKKVGIIPVDERLTVIDIRSEFDIYLANQIFERMKKEGFI